MGWIKRRFNRGVPSVNEIYKQYGGLWVVEKIYRISKDMFDMRPMFHFTEKRIKAAVCICFIACKVAVEVRKNYPLLHLEVYNHRLHGE
jgi:transposase